MITTETFDSVWDAIADTPEQAANMRTRAEGDRTGERLDPLQIRIAIQPGPFHEGSLPVPKQEAVIKHLWKPTGAGETWLIVEYRAGTGSATAAAQHGKFLGVTVGPINQGRLRRRQHLGAGIID